MKTLGGDIMEEKKKEQDLWLKVFCPNTRCLTDQEVAALPEEKRKLAETEGGKGIWLAVKGRLGTDRSGQTGVPIPVRAAAEEDQKGFWLKLFCPEDECVLDQPTDLP
jgi:hypothetical protein